MTQFGNNQKNAIFEKNIQWPGHGLDHIIDKTTGNLITDAETIKEIVKTFFQNIMTDKDINTPVTIPDDWKPYYHHEKQEQQLININHPIIQEELKSQLKSLPNNKAPKYQTTFLK